MIPIYSLHWYLACVERSFEVKLPASGQSQRRESQQKSRKPRNTLCFSERVASPESRKVIRLAKGVGAEPSGRMSVQKVAAAPSTCGSQNAKSTSGPEHFWKLICWKVHAAVALSTCRSQNVKNTAHSDYLWTFKRHFIIFCGRRNGVWMSLHLDKSEPNQQLQKRWQAWAVWRGSAKTHCAWQARYKRHLHQTCGQGAAFLRRVAFWSVISSGSLRWFCLPGHQLPRQHVIFAGCLAELLALTSSICIFAGSPVHLFHFLQLQLPFL